MIERVNNISQKDEKIMEKVIVNDNVHIVHMIFNKDEGAPIHNANADVYMTVMRGELSIKLEDQEFKIYKKGTILEIPYKTKMDIRNKSNDILELLVVKTPAPGNYEDN